MEDKLKTFTNKLIEEGYDETDPIIQLLNKHELKWDNPEQVFALHCFMNEQAMRTVLKQLYPNANTNTLTFLFQHYDFVEHQIQSVLQDLSMEGGICDKSRWVLKQWFRTLTNQEPENITERKMYHPDFGCVNLWIQFCEVAMSIYYKGLTESNVSFLQTINKMSMEVYNGRH
jgi:hypothetical protein